MKLYVFESSYDYQFSVMAWSEQQARDLIDQELRGPMWADIHPSWPDTYKVTTYDFGKVCFSRLGE